MSARALGRRGHYSLHMHSLRKAVEETVEEARELRRALDVRVLDEFGEEAFEEFEGETRLRAPGEVVNRVFDDVMEQGWFGDRYLGRGSDRFVVAVKNTWVLKFAKSVWGEDANRSELAAWRNLSKRAKKFMLPIRAASQVVVRPWSSMREGEEWLLMPRVLIAGDTEAPSWAPIMPSVILAATLVDPGDPWNKRNWGWYRKRWVLVDYAGAANPGW